MTIQAILDTIAPGKSKTILPNIRAYRTTDGRFFTYEVASNRLPKGRRTVAFSTLEEAKHLASNLPPLTRQRRPVEMPDAAPAPDDTHYDDAPCDEDDESDESDLSDASDACEGGNVREAAIDLIDVLACAITEGLERKAPKHHIDSLQHMHGYLISRINELTEASTPHA